MRCHIPLVILLTSILIVTLAPVAVASDHGLEKDLSRDLAQTRPLIAKIKAGRQTKGDMERLRGLAESIKAAHLLLDERFKQREQEPGLQGPKAKERHLRMRQKYRQAMDEYVTLLEGVAQGRDLQAATLDRLLVLLNKLLPKQKRPIYGSLPYRHLRYSAKSPLLTPVITPAYQGGDKAVVAADTAATPEVPISEEIAALANALGWSPVAIYEWVKNNIETEWYWGCMKGAEETLRQKSGNDADQATLLIALLRAAGYPCRYVRGVIEFFPDIEAAKNLTGIADEQELAAFFQKAGIPYKQVVAGGRIANLQIEHVWVESYIPYANYRGVVIDDQGKTWLGLDTAIKAAGYTYNTPKSIPSEVSLPGVRDDYLAAVQTELPLEYLQAQIQAILPAGSTYADLLATRQLIPEEMRILPASLQFKEIAITAEYAAMPQELTHQARFKAIAPDNSELFNVTLPAFTLTSRSISLTYEPETVEDQEIINSYGGLGNTPSYLIRLRPVLLVDGERMAIGTDGFASGTEYTLNLDLISPSGTEKISNTLIIGNLAVLGLVAQKPSSLSQGGEGEKDAQQLLFEQAISYIDRWNQAETELASLLGLTLARPLPTVVTLGGVVEITSLLDIPQGFAWKGVYVDANLRAIELATGYGLQAKGDAQRIFMQLASLQGSILENRIFEDAFQVESVSTAKLFGLAPLAGVSLVAIDKSNISTLLPTLAVADDIKEAIQNAVNQNLTIRIPNSEISYEDWTGIGFLAENPATGEAGWMLSGEIAGGMTVWNPERWPVEVRETLEDPYAVPPNKNPLAASTIEKINATDRQTGIVGQALKDTLKVLVLDKDKNPVQGAKVTFTIKAGGGKLRTVTKPGEQPQEGGTLTVLTDHGGVARIQLILGEKTSANPTMWWKEGYTYSQQAGENIVDASLASGTALAVPFVAYGFPDETTATMRMLHGDGTTVDILSFAGFVSVAVEDQYANPISNYPVEFKASDIGAYCVPGGENRLSALLVPAGDPCITAFPTYGTCSTSPNAGKALTAITNYRDAAVQIFTGAVPNAVYPITATCDKATATKSVTFNLYTYGFGNCDGGSPPSSKFFVGYVYAADQYGNNITARAVGETIPLNARIYFLREGEMEKKVTITCDSNTAECEKTVGSKVYSEDTNFETASVTFGGEPGTTEGNGIFRGQYQLQAGVNNIAIHGTAKAATPKHWTRTGCDGSTIICSPVTEEVKGDETFTVQVYGVAITVPSKLPVMVDQDGYAITDVPITYTIVPAQYQAATAYVAIMKKDASGTSQPLLYIPGKTQGTDTVTLSRGFWFDINGTYEAQVILNYGTGVEIKSNMIPLTISQIAMEGDFKIIENETLMTIIKGSIIFRTLGGMRLHFECKTSPQLNIASYEWSTTGGKFFNGYNLDAKELTGDALKGKNLNEIYWEGAYSSALNEMVTLKLTLEDGTLISRTIQVISRVIQYGNTGDDVKMLQSFLRMIGISEGDTPGVLGTPVTVDGNFSLKTKRAVERMQERDQITKDGIIGDGTLVKIKLHWDDYLLAYEAYPSDTKINNTHPKFPDWIEAGTNILAQTYTDAIQQSVDPNTSREELEASWVNQESEKNGHWGYNVNYRISLGSAEENGSIGFCQIVNKFKFGKSPSPIVSNLNVYHPEDSVKTLAAWANDPGLIKAFVGNPPPFKKTKNYSTNEYPRLGNSYTDDNKDTLSKGIMAYNHGSFEYSFTWPQMLQKYNKPSEPPYDVRWGIKYSLEVQQRAGMPLRTWTWTAQRITTGVNGKCETTAAGDDVQVIIPGIVASQNEVCISPGNNGVIDTTPGGDDQLDEFSFNYSETEWLSGSKTWTQKMLEEALKK